MTAAALYIRYSSEMQRDGYSIEAQLTACRDLCNQRGYTITGEYIDEAKSGKDTKRPAFQQMLADARQSRFNVLVCHKLDRLSRNLGDILTTIDDLRNRSVTFVSVGEPFDFTTPSGGIMLAVMGALAQWYRENLALEVAKGKKAKAKAGGHNGIIPTGYKLIVDESRPVRANEKPPTKIVLSDLAPHIREAFEAYATDTYTDGDIADMLNSRGLTTNSHWGDRAFSKDTVCAILKNKFYAGYVVYRGMSDQKRESGIRKRNSKKDAVYSRGDHEPIISEELFERCMIVRNKRGDKFRGTRPATGGRVYLLQRIGRCAKCGQSLRATNWTNRTAGYRCTSKERGLSCDCVSKAFPQLAIVDQLAEIVKGLQLEEGMRDEARRIIATDEAAAKYEAEKRKLETELKRVSKMYQMGVMGEDQFERDVLRIRAMQADLLPPPSVTNMQEALETLSNMSELWTGATMLERQEILQTVFEEIHVDTDNRMVTGVIPRKEYAALVGAAYFVPDSSDRCGNDGIRTRGLRRDRATC